LITITPYILITSICNNQTLTISLEFLNKVLDNWMRIIFEKLSCHSLNRKVTAKGEYARVIPYFLFSVLQERFSERLFKSSCK